MSNHQHPTGRSPSSDEPFKILTNNEGDEYFPLQKLILGEVNTLILAMRNVHSMRFSNRYRFVSVKQ